MKCINPYAAKKVYLHSKKAFGIFTLTLLLFSSFLIINQNAEAQLELSCPMRAIEQITDETAGDSFVPSINADGTRIAFVSTADINMGNPDENFEIYLANCFDLDARTIPTLSEWELIAMAAILGIVGFMVIRRRKVTA